jgi:23S rRNA pseudouridine2605 synthase
MFDSDKIQNKRTFHKDKPSGGRGSGRTSAPKRPSRPRSRDDEEGEERPRRTGGRRSFDSDQKRSFDGDKRRSFGKGRGEDKPRRSFTKSRPDRDGDDRPRRNFDRDGESRPRRESGRSADKGPRRRDVTAESEILSEIVAKRRREGRPSPEKVKVRSLEQDQQSLPIRLNKYIANAGVCSRREADTLIEAGAISVNGTVVTELGFKVKPTDEVRFGDTILQRERPVYLLLNKPKDYITTMDDEFDRKHVMQLVKGACKERIYPVGRLDRDTTGLLLFTNDGEMTKKLTHPRSNVYKIYHVTLNKNLTHADFQQIADGVELDDGQMEVDEISYVGDHKDEVGVTIHSGRNRIVRRLFEKLGYEVVKLDRVVFAGLTKKDLPRGSWRFLTQEEINYLKMIGSNK